MSGGKIAAIAAGVLVLLAASGVGAYIALNPDHGLFGTASNDKRTTDTTKISADADAQRRAEEEARRKADEELRKRQEAEAEAKRRGDAEAKRRAEEERKKAEEEVKRQEEARRRAEEERRRVEEERKKAEEERKRREEEARRGQGDEERKRAEEEARRQEQARREEESRRREDEAARRADEERRRREEQEEARRREEEERSKPKTVSCELSVIRGVYASETDCFYVIRLFKLTLETARDGAGASTWTNQRSGSSGSMRILATIPGQDGTMCRRFQQTLTVAGKTYSGTGVACFRNSAWQISS